MNTLNPNRYFGRSVTRGEDRALLTGTARYLDDIEVPGLLEVAFLRSPHAHARILEIDASAALEMEGVVTVLAYDDLRPSMTQDRMPLQLRGSNLPTDCTPVPLAKDEVCFVGEAIAMVVATSRYIAEDAMNAVMIDYDVLEAVVDCRAGAKPDAPLARTWTSVNSNVLTRFSQDYGDISGAFANAAGVAKVNLQQHRGAAHSIETRGVLASHDAGADVTTMWSSTQSSHEVRAFVMEMLGLDDNQVRVIAPDVGGGFGAKFCVYPEEIAMAAATRLLNRPIKWVEDRREHFLAAIQEKDQFWDLEVAYDADGHILGVRGHMTHDHGAYTPQGINLPYNASTAFPGPYILPAYHLDVDVVETNKPPSMPVRGAGYPEGCFAMERSMDAIARALGMDRAEVRMRNLVKPEQMPYTTPLKSRSGSAVMYDSGDFVSTMATAMEMIDYAGFAERQETARKEGRYLGIAIGNGVKGTGRGPFESAIVRIGRTGRVSVYTGAMAMGQGLKTALAQICAEQVGVDPAEVKVISGDTSTIPLGLGGFASRQTVTAGNSTHLAAKAVREKMLKAAGMLLQSPEAELDITNGIVHRKDGDPNSGVTIRHLAEMLGGDPGYSIEGKMSPGLESYQNFMPDGLTYAMGCHAVEVEVNAATCAVKINRYIVVNDCGRAVNPRIVEGQIRGGVAHGIGNALYEWMGYDETGQPTTTNLGEYLLVTAPEVPRIEIKLLEYPSLLNPLGVKGVGEAGCVPAAATILSAVENALSPHGVIVSETPLVPTRVFELMHAAGGKTE